MAGSPGRLSCVTGPRDEEASRPGGALVFMTKSARHCGVVSVASVAREDSLVGLLSAGAWSDHKRFHGGIALVLLLQLRRSDREEESVEFLRRELERELVERTGACGRLVALLVLERVALVHVVTVVVEINGWIRDWREVPGLDVKVKLLLERQLLIRYSIVERGARVVKLERLLVVTAADVHGVSTALALLGSRGGLHE